MITIEEFHEKYGRLPTEVDKDWLREVFVSKFQQLELPIMAPGKCGACRSNKRDGRIYLDFGVDVEDGVLYLCSRCIKEAARAVGLISSEPRLADDLQMNKLLNNVSTGITEVLGLVQALKLELEGVRGGLDRTDSSAGIVNDDEPDSNVSDDSEDKSDDDSGDEDESGTTEQDSVPRRSDLPSLTDLLGPNYGKSILR